MGNIHQYNPDSCWPNMVRSECGNYTLQGHTGTGRTNNNSVVGSFNFNKITLIKLFFLRNLFFEINRYIL